MFSNFDKPIVETSKPYRFQARSEKLIFGKISKGYYVLQPMNFTEKFHIMDLFHTWNMWVLGPAEDDSVLRFEIRCILRVKIYI